MLMSDIACHCSCTVCDCAHVCVLRGLSGHRWISTPGSERELKVPHIRSLYLNAANLASSEHACMDYLTEVRKEETAFVCAHTHKHTHPSNAYN